MSYTYKEQLSIVRDIVLVEGERKILNCPFFGGSRKFSITKTDGKVLWNCFRASCAASGSYQGTISIDACKAKLPPSKLHQSLYVQLHPYQASQLSSGIIPLPCNMSQTITACLP